MNDLNHIFAALADPTRRAIVARLAKGDATVGELAGPFKISPPAISRHLKVLEHAALITNERQGKHRRCHLQREVLTSAAEWIDFHRSFWSGSLDRLEVRLKQTKKDKKS
jgi:DNA-binding transcriptional ArsR family regulator